MAQSGWLKKSLEEAARRASDLPEWVKRLNQAIESNPSEVAPRQSGSYPASSGRHETGGQSEGERQAS